MTTKTENSDIITRMAENLKADPEGRITLQELREKIGQGINIKFIHSLFPDVISKSVRSKSDWLIVEIVYIGISWKVKQEESSEFFDILEYINNYKLIDKTEEQIIVEYLTGEEINRDQLTTEITFKPDKTWSVSVRNKIIDLEALRIRNTYKFNKASVNAVVDIVLKFRYCQGFRYEKNIIEENPKFVQKKCTQFVSYSKKCPVVLSYTRRGNLCSLCLTFKNHNKDKGCKHGSCDTEGNDNMVETYRKFDINFILNDCSQNKIATYYRLKSELALNNNFLSSSMCSKNTLMLLAKGYGLSHSANVKKCCLAEKLFEKVNDSDEIPFPNEFIHQSDEVELPHISGDNIKSELNISNVDSYILPSTSTSCSMLTSQPEEAVESDLKRTSNETSKGNSKRRKKCPSDLKNRKKVQSEPDIGIVVLDKWCYLCHKPYNEVDEWIRCEICKSWIDRKCSKLNHEEWKYFKSVDVHYACPVCE